MGRCVARRGLSLTAAGLLIAASAVAIRGQASAPATLAPVTAARFARPADPIALTGPARPERDMAASGRKAALLGRADGSFEAWVYPLKVLHDFRLSFGTPDYADPIPGINLASSVDVRPEASTPRGSHLLQIDVPPANPALTSAVLKRNDRATLTVTVHTGERLR